MPNDTLPFIGEIRSFGFDFAPNGWSICAGQLLAINQNTALFSILGTTYGGDGRTNFALPDLRGRMPRHSGQGPGLADVSLGEVSGSESVTLQATEMPVHGHGVMASADLASDASPAGKVMGAKGRGGVDVYAPAGNPVALAPGAVANAGATQAHENMQPSLTINYCIAQFGIFPSRN